jgi:flagellar biosynthesis GTPase FlhF
MMHNLQNNECIDAKIESLLSVATDNKKTLKRTKHVNNFDSSKKVKIYNSKISNNSDTSSDDILPDVIELQSAFDNIHTQKVAQLVFKHVIHTTPGLPFALAFGWAQESFVESDMYRIFDHHLKDGISPVQFLYRLWDRYRNLKDYRGLRHLLSLIEFLYDSCNVDIFKNNIKDDFIALIHDFITYMNDLKDEIKKEFKRGMLEAEMAAKRAREADEDARVAEIEAKMKAYAEQLRSENEHSDDEPILTSQAIVDESEDYDFLKFFLITLKSGSHLLDNISDKINDKLWIKLYDFVARICVFFTRTLCQQNVSDLALPDLIIFVKSIFIEGADIVSTIFKGVIHLFENLPKYLRGEDTIFCGVDRSRKLESTAATLRSLTSAVLGGDEKTLLQEGYTISSYLIALDEAIKDCTDACNTVKSAQRPYLSNLLYTLKDIKNKIDNAHLQQVTRPEPFAIALFGKSGVGKSTITPKLAKIMIMATGEQYNDKLVVTGDINDKYDSVETSRHKCIIYDDVGNSVNKVPDFDKVLTAINSQPRMFNKSEAQEKGKHFPSNTSTIITSNVVGLNAYKTSVEPQSILRRFDYHILTEIWDPRVKAEGTDRIDPILISKLTPDDKNRIWTFKVYKFVTFDPNMIKEDMSGEDKASLVRLNNNPNDHSWYKLVKTFDGSKCDSLDHLEAFLGRECKIKYDTGYNRVNVDIQQEPKCTTCFHKESSCICTSDSMESQGFIRDQAHKFLHNICDIKDLSWSRCYSYKLNPFYYMEIIKLCYIAQYADAENYIRIKCEQMDNHLDNKFESIRLYWWRYIFIHSLTFFTKLYFQNFMYFIFGLISVTGIIGKLYSWFIAFIFLLITSCITIRIIYFIQCIKMSDYAFYEQVTLPRKGEFKKYRVTQKVVTSIACLTAFYAFYRVFLSGKQQVVQSQRTDKPYSETEVRSFHKALPRSNKARCTNSSQFEKIMDTNIARVIINYNDGSQSVSNTCNLDSNMFVITGHSVPKKGTFDLTINYMKENSHLIAHEKLSAINDVYRVPGRDLCMIQVPSCQPRKSLKDYLPYGTYNEDKPCLGRNAKFVSSSETLGCQILNEPPKWVPSTEAGRVNVETYIPQSFTPEKGDCGSAIISPVTSNIVGFHIGYLKKLNRGAFQRIFRSDLENAKKYFERTNFLPHSMGELHKGNIELSLDCENATHLTSQIDPSVNLPLDEHNLCVYGANPLAKFSAKNYYRDHPYKSSVESVFGPEKYSPPVKINSAHHKRKALTKLASPNQDFVKQDVIYAVEDYLKPIFDFIDNKSPEEKSEYGRVLSDQETLDGIPFIRKANRCMIINSI